MTRAIILKAIGIFLLMTVPTFALFALYVADACKYGAC